MGYYPCKTSCDGQAMKSGIWVLSLALLLAGCVASSVEVLREGDTGIGTQDSVVVLGKNLQTAGHETEIGYIGCVGSSLLGTETPFQVISQERFKDLTFPWFEPRFAPREMPEFSAYMDEPLLRDRVESLGVRYIVWIEGTTENTGSSGGMTCAASPAGAGCFGFVSWEKSSQYEASIWDVHNNASVGKISSQASGTSFMPAVIVPVPMIARVQANACSNMAEQIEEFLAG